MHCSVVMSVKKGKVFFLAMNCKTKPILSEPKDDAVTSTQPCWPKYFIRKNTKRIALCLLIPFWFNHYLSPACPYAFRCPLSINTMRRNCVLRLLAYVIFFRHILWLAVLRLLEPTEWRGKKVD